MYEKFIAKRCGKLLAKDKTYMALQKRCAEAYKKMDLELYSDLATELQAYVEIECYRCGWIDNGAQKVARFIETCKNIKKYILINKMFITIVFVWFFSVFKM